MGHDARGPTPCRNPPRFGPGNDRTDKRRRGCGLQTKPIAVTSTRSRSHVGGTRRSGVGPERRFSDGLPPMTIRSRRRDSLVRRTSGCFSGRDGRCRFPPFYVIYTAKRQNREVYRFSNHASTSSVSENACSGGWSNSRCTQSPLPSRSGRYLDRYQSGRSAMSMSASAAVSTSAFVL